WLPRQRCGVPICERQNGLREQTQNDQSFRLLVHGPSGEARSPTSRPLCMARVRGGREACPAEITLDGLHFPVLQSEVLDIAEGLSALRPAEVFYERLVAGSEHPLQVVALDEGTLRVPASPFEGGLADVIVGRRAREGEAVGQQRVEQLPVLSLPCPIVFPDDCPVCRAQARPRARACRRRQACRHDERADSRSERRAARDSEFCHGSFHLCGALRRVGRTERYYFTKR